MKSFGDLEMWFVTGSQQLYGEKILAQVAADSKTIAGALDGSPAIPVRVVYKPVLTTPEAIRALCLEANLSPSCIGLATWMHTFSPAKMWIAGLSALQKPFVHLHTQFNRDIPWDTIDMEFMNLNQSAHGDREFGFIGTRLRARRKVVVGHWQDPEVLARLGVWARAAGAWHDAQGARVARFGDNMREVAVTEGDKVEAQIRLGYDVYGYAAADLAARLEQVSAAEAQKLLAEYDQRYPMDKSLRQGGERRGELEQAARLEAGMRAFLEEGGFKAFTTNFEHLHGLPQLPGLAVQRLMAAGCGFGAEGDWKTAALVRAMKVMGRGLPGGTSFMEDYTYHLDPKGMKVLGAHMLELCESIAGRPALPGDPSPVHRRQGRPGAAGVQRRRGSRRERLAHRPGQPLPPGGERGGGRGREGGPAQAAGGPRGLGAEARLEDGRRRLDPGRRRPPHRLQPGGGHRAPGGLRPHGRDRAGPDRRRHHPAPVRAGAGLGGDAPPPGAGPALGPPRPACRRSWSSTTTPSCASS